MRFQTGAPCHREGIGIARHLWIVFCVGDALFAFEVDQRLSDAIADAVPILLAGGIGCCLAWSIALVIRGRAENGRLDLDDERLERPERR